MLPLIQAVSLEITFYLSVDAPAGGIISGETYIPDSLDRGCKAETVEMLLR